MSEKQSKQYSEKLLQKAFGCEKIIRVGKKFKHEFTIGDLAKYSIVRPESKIKIDIDTGKKTMSISFNTEIEAPVIAKDLRILADIFEGKMTFKKN